MSPSSGTPGATRAASGGWRGLGQGIFQLGGQAGGLLGPLLAARIVAQRGQSAIAWFASLALVARALAVWIARRQIAAAAALSRTRGAPSAAPRYPGRTVAAGMVVPTLLMASKNAYSEGFRSFYTCYLPARQREWKTDTGKANFHVPSSLDEGPDTAVEPQPDVLQLTSPHEVLRAEC